MKKLRWILTQMGCSQTYACMDDMIGDLRDIGMNGLNGDEFTMKAVEMTDEEFNALPEFEGR